MGLLVPALASAGHNAAAITAFNGDGGANSCVQCHGVGTTQLNGANTTATTLNHIFNSSRSDGNYMSCSYAQNLNATARAQIANWFLDIIDGSADDAVYSSRLFTIANANAAINSNVTLDASTHINPGSYAFSHIETVSVSTGSLTWSGSTGTYTPPNSTFVGNVTFTYRGRDTRNLLNIFGHTFSGTLRIGAAPNINSSTTPSGIVGTALSYTITATNAPTSYGHTGTLPTGTSRTNAVISGTPSAAGSFPVTVSATNALGTDNQPITFTIGAGTPSVATFPAQSAQTLVAGNTFSITNPATLSPALAESQLDARYVSQTPGVCTTPGTTSTTVTMVTAGTCTIRASTTASAPNWLASSNFLDRNITINAGTKTITFAATQNPASQNWSSGGTFPIFPVATINPPTETITYGTSTPTVCTALTAPPTVNILRAGACTITANSAANSNYTVATQQSSAVTIAAIDPAAPVIGTATPADTQASIAFTPLNTTNDGGASILQYTATCMPGSITGTNAGSPILVSGLTNGQLYSCSVTATQVAPHSRTGPASATVNVTPAVYPAITSANNTTFTVLVPGTFNVTATGSPAPTLQLTSGTLPAGITFNGPGISPRTLSGTPASGTVGNHLLVFTADGSDPDATQNFTLTIAKRNQVVNFTDPADTTFGSGNVALIASATSTLPVTFTSLTPAICGISGANATLLDVGNCQVRASQAGDADWNSALADQTFAIAKGDQAITFNAQVTASRPVAPGQTFLVDPVATVSSPLTVTYSTTNASVCTAAGTTITMNNAGTCGIVASQAGNTQWNAATDVTQNVTLGLASQAITFPAQADQDYIPGATFGISPVAFSSSGLAISYTTDTTSVCTIPAPAVPTVNIVAMGDCVIKADQAGNGNYFPAPTVTATVRIVPKVPDAPTLGTLSPGNQHAKVAFAAPAQNGGSAILDYTATCMPGNITGTATASPITVTGLANGTPYTCSVTARNSVGTGPASASGGVMPALQGATLWSNICSSCHGTPPGDPLGARVNAAGSSLSTQVLDYVIANNPQMNVLPQVTSLNALERLDLKQYLTSFLPPINEETRTDLPKHISVGSQVVLNTAFIGGVPGSFTHIVVDVPPAFGTLSAFNGVEVVYTPNPGYVGLDSFSYHGRRDSPMVVTGDTHVVNITVGPAAALLTISPNPGNGTGLVYSDTPTSGINCGADCSEGYAFGTVVRLFAQPASGSTFIGWSGGVCSGVAISCDVTMDALAKGVTATFDLTPINLTVAKAGTGTGTVTSNPAGISCGATCTVGFTPGTPVTLLASPDAGSMFTGWSGACTGNGACVVAMDAVKSVTATFQPSFFLTVAKAGTGTGSIASNPAGIACGATCTFEYVTGTVVSLTPTPDAGFAFTGWSGACTGTGACNVTMTAARSVTATFVPTRTLTVSRLGTGAAASTVTSNPAGIACGATCSADFADATIVQLTATPGPNVAFNGWGGACAGAGACSVTMDQVRSVTATFTTIIPQYSLTVAKIGSGTGTVTSDPAGIACGPTCVASFDENTVVTLTRQATTGSSFAGWSGPCSGIGLCVVTMSQARSVIAAFDPVVTAGSAEVSIAQSAAPNAVGSGKDVVFTIDATNLGPATATGVVVTGVVPGGATFVWASPQCLHAAGTVSCALGSLAAGSSARVHIVLRASVAGSLTHTATVASVESDPASTNNGASTMVTVNATPAGVPVLRYRLYSPVTLEHHFTTDLNEYTVLGNTGGTWIQEGTVGRVLDNPGAHNGVGAVPYYRLYDNNTRWHHWTTDANEYYTLAGIPGWSAEGVDGYVLPTAAPGTIELYRLTYPAIPGLHHWTIDPVEYNALITQFGWIGEGGSGFVVP